MMKVDQLNQLNYSWFVKLLLLIVLVGGVSYTFLPVNVIPHTITLDIEDANTADHLQLFFDTGEGFNEHDSIFYKKKTVEGNIIKWTFVPRHKIIKLRIDPFKNGGERVIRSLTLTIYNRTFILQGKDLVNSFQAVQGISSLYEKDGAFHIVASGDDPYLVSTIDFDSIYNTLTSGNTPFFITYYFNKGIIILGLLLISFIAYKATLRRKNIGSGWELGLQSDRFIYYAIVSFLFIWFMLQALYFAGHVDYGVFPDERGWVELSQLFKEYGGLRLPDSPDIYHLGNTSCNPYLYFLFTGKVLAAGTDSLQSHLYVMRGFSIVCGLFTFLFTLLLSRRVTSNRFVSVAVLMCLSNLPMFVFISAAASYDPVANLLGVLTSYFSVLYYQSRKYVFASLSFICMLVGALVKVTFLPFILFQTAITTLFWGVCIYQKKDIFRQIKSLSGITSSILLLIVLALTFELYGTNILRYGQVLPTQERVLGTEIARTHHGITKRDYEYRLTRDEREEIGFFEYIPKWFQIIESRTLGIMGHENIYKSKHDLQGYRILFWICVLFLLYRWKAYFNNKNLLYLLALALSYIAFLFLYNYNKQVNLRVLGLVVQGRYLFPVLPQLLIALFFGFFHKRGPILSVLFLIALFIVGLHGGLDYFLQHGGDAFFNH